MDDMRFLKRFYTRAPPISDADLFRWVSENLQPGITAPYTDRTTEQICSWMVRRIKNSKNGTRLVYNTMRLQELRNNPPDRLPDPEKFMKRFEDEWYRIDRPGEVSRRLSRTTLTEYLDDIIGPRIYGITGLMSVYGKNKDPFFDYLAGRSARP